MRINMTPYTDTQLKQTLAKMLPTEVYWECREGFSTTQQSTKE